MAEDGVAFRLGDGKNNWPTRIPKMNRFRIGQNVRPMALIPVIRRFRLDSGSASSAVCSAGVFSGIVLFGKIRRIALTGLSVKL